MVRLKAVFLEIIGGGNMKFQFHYGAIKRKQMNLPQSNCLGYFNSIMVRLKEKGITWTYKVLIVFQFHYGAIKRHTKVYFNHFGLTFQFHYGAIKRPKKWRMVFTFFCISIPLWCD